MCFKSGGEQQGEIHLVGITFIYHFPCRSVRTGSQLNHSVHNLFLIFSWDKVHGKWYGDGECWNEEKSTLKKVSVLLFYFSAVMVSSLSLPDLPKCGTDENPSLKKGFMHLQKQRTGCDHHLRQWSSFKRLKSASFSGVLVLFPPQSNLEKD